MSGPTLSEKLQAARDELRSLGSVLVAFSGGVDSALVLKLAAETLGSRAIALSALSPAVPEETWREAQSLVELLGVQWVPIRSDELANPDYAKNPTNRCYFCKTELYALCEQQRVRLGVHAIVDGLNGDDLADHRPGRQAAEEHRVRSPLASAGLTKADVRECSKQLGLPTWDKPAMPCLASRIPYGTSVTAQRLRQIGAAESALRGFGLRVFRVRYHGDLARIEVAADELPRFDDAQFRTRALEAVRAQGFSEAIVDAQPFRSGRLNELAGIR